MSTQLHKRLSLEPVQRILNQYFEKELPAKEARVKLGLGKTQFHSLVSRYQKEGSAFTLHKKRATPPRKISDEAEQKIIQELSREKQLIDNKDMPIRHYNYAAVRDVLRDKHAISVSPNTIINRAKEHGFYLERPKRAVHERVVRTDFMGELVQHDASLHLWSPYMDHKLSLITSLDDYSRQLLFADFFERETSWNHISALQSVMTQFGCPMKYYADQHSIFRYVKNRDVASNWVNYTTFTDDVDTQWRAVLRRCQVETVYALSPQAKGKIERPYRWIQDRVVRTASKEKLTTISELREVLYKLVDQYNNHWVHSTTKEIPVVRFENALNNNLCLFKPLQRVLLDTDLKDIFCLTAQRKVDGYKRISFEKNVLELPNATARQVVDINIVFDTQKQIAELRFWQLGKLIEIKTLPTQKLPEVRF